jgi:hypothetical protein
VAKALNLKGSKISMLKVKKLYSKVVLRKSSVIWVLLYIHEKSVACGEFLLASK